MPSRERKFTFYDEPYVIEVREGKKPDGEWVRFTAYGADEYNEAVAHVNRIDRHRDVRLVKLPTDWRSVLDRKFDALEVYIRSL